MIVVSRQGIASDVDDRWPHYVASLNMSKYVYLGTRVSDRTLAREVALQTEHATPTYESMLFIATRKYG